jgi:tetratricopeptide (TPR) repeat protein
MTAFKQVLSNLQLGQREEAAIGLEFVLRLDPTFVPATNLKRQLTASSNEIDLGDVIAQLQAPTTDAINTLLIEAVDDFNSRDFLAAKEKVEQVLIDLPGHQEARDLRDQVAKALKIENQVGQFLVQAREALAKGDPQEAGNFVMMAQALDPHHTGIATTLKEIDQTGGLAFSQEQPVPAVPASPDATQPVATSPTAPKASVGEVRRPGVRPAQPGPPALRPAQPGPPAAPPAPPAAPSTEDNQFDDEFETNDPFADFIARTPVSPEGEPAPDLGQPADDDVIFPTMDETADLFSEPNPMLDVGSNAASIVGPAAAIDGFSLDEVSPDEDSMDDESSMAATIEELIERGRGAFEGSDPAAAISIWSRVLLVKPGHPEIGHLIEGARKRLTTMGHQVDDLLSKARDAFDENETEAAKLLLAKAFTLWPGHLEATLLKEEMDAAWGASGPRSAPATSAEEQARSADSGAASAVPELPDLDDDLFTEVPEERFGATAASGYRDAFFEDDLGHLMPQTLLGRLQARFSLRLVGIAAVGLVVVLAGVWLGSRFLESEPEIDEASAVTEVLARADQLYREHKVEEAIHLLKEFPASGLFKQRIDIRLAKYEEIVAPPTPTPVPQHAVHAEELLERGLWWAAFMAASEGLAAFPDDRDLLEIRRQVIEIEPEAPALDNALKSHDYRMAVSITEDLLQQYPEQGDLRVTLERSLFNAALAEARAYNLTGAENHLQRLLELRPEDEETLRFYEFVQKYKIRAADMRLEIFIRSMSER